MELKATLLTISNDARGWLKIWARDFTEGEARRPEPGSRSPNPLAWQLGHLACVEDEVARLFTMEASPEPLVPVSLRAVCATGSPPPETTTSYPSLAELWTLLEQTHSRLLGLLEAAEPAELDRPPRIASRHFHSLGQAVYETALHENYHVGEIGALRKALDKPRIG
jgi:DinB family protein